MISMCNEICSLLDRNLTGSIQLTDSIVQLIREPFFLHDSESESESDSVKIPSNSSTRKPPYLY